MTGSRPTCWLSSGARPGAGTWPPISRRRPSRRRWRPLAASTPRYALELMAELPDDQRRAVQGRVIEERDYPELARNLACSESVVRQRVSRGLRSLRERLEQIG